MPTIVSPRILIVDDEVEITEILADLLSEEYDCIRAGSAEEALTRLHEGEFQLVISDITMSVPVSSNATSAPLSEFECVITNHSRAKR